ncbi:MAG: alpha/beta hydrolase [Chloroflexota bacterium]
MFHNFHFLLRRFQGLYCLLFVLSLLLLPNGQSISVAQAAPTIANSPYVVATFSPCSDVIDPATAFFAENDLVPGEVYTLEHFVPLDDERSIHVTELFTLESWSGQRRAALFLTGPEFKGSFWTIPVDGYNGPAMAAERGMFAFTVDYLGVGQSFKPATGRHLNYLAQVDPMRAVLDYIRYLRQVRRVDLIGEGYGGEIASQLAADPQRVRSVVMSTLVYNEFSPEILPFFTDELHAFIENSADGYWQPDFLDLTLGNTPKAQVRDYVKSTQFDVYPTGGVLEFWDQGRPLFDVSIAKVPGLVITGSEDPFPAPSDMQSLADAWGHGPAELVVIEGANHVPRIEAVEFANQYWDAVFDFWGLPEASIQ